MATPFHGMLATVRETTAAHASALIALEDAVDAQTVPFEPCGAASHHYLFWNRASTLARRQAKLAEDRRALEVERDAMRTELTEEREAVARDRADLEAELARIRAVQPSTDERIKLNVGGVRYETSRATLTSVPETMLETMFGKRADMLQRDPDDGSVFIDRDSERFGLILDYMRDRDASRVAEVIEGLPQERQEAMVQELDFFGLKDAVFPPPPWFDEAAFALGPEMDQARHDCAAVLHGRRAVVFGGHDRCGSLASTAVLDLDTMTFVPGPDMSTGRCVCAAVLLDARSALVVGGYGRGGRVMSTEILDLETMVFSAGLEMLTSRSGCAAVALDARRILVAGGDDDEQVDLKTTEVLDLETMTFAPGPDMLSERYGCTAVKLDAQLVLIIGGENDDVYLETTEVLDVRTMVVSPDPSMRSKRRYCAAVSLDSQHHLVIGGCLGHGRSKTTEVLDIETMEFRDGPGTNEVRCGTVSVVDGNAHWYSGVLMIRRCRRFYASPKKKRGFGGADADLGPRAFLLLPEPLELDRGPRHVQFAQHITCGPGP